MCPLESVGWLRTVHHKLLNIGLAIAEKTSIEEVLGSSHSVSFPGHLGYQEFFQAQFGLQPLMDQFWSRYTLESHSDMAKVMVLQRSADAHAVRGGQTP